MFPPRISLIRSARLLGLLVTALALILSCSPPQPKPTGVAYEFDSAKDMFKRGRFDRVSEFADDPATASPPNVFSPRYASCASISIRFAFGRLGIISE